MLRCCSAKQLSLISKRSLTYAMGSIWYRVCPVQFLMVFSSQVTPTQAEAQGYRYRYFPDSRLKLRYFYKKPKLSANYGPAPGYKLRALEQKIKSSSNLPNCPMINSLGDCFDGEAITQTVNHGKVSIYQLPA